MVALTDRWRIGLCPGWRFERSEHEYWTRWLIGPVYLLRGRSEPARSADWREDCLLWRGRELTGLFAHWCADWDDLPIDETCREWPCACAKDLGYPGRAD